MTVRYMLRMYLNKALKTCELHPGSERGSCDLHEINSHVISWYKYNFL